MLMQFNYFKKQRVLYKGKKQVVYCTWRPIAAQVVIYSSIICTRISRDNPNFCSQTSRIIEDFIVALWIFSSWINQKSKFWFSAFQEKWKSGNWKCSTQRLGLIKLKKLMYTFLMTWIRHCWAKTRFVLGKCLNRLQST